VPARSILRPPRNNGYEYDNICTCIRTELVLHVLHVSEQLSHQRRTTEASVVPLNVPTTLSFVDQVREVTSNFVPPPAYTPWITKNTFFVIFFRNTNVTTAWNQSSWSMLSQQIVDSYFEQVQILYNAGARSFMFMKIHHFNAICHVG
jgi:hypothetical protein